MEIVDMTPEAAAMFAAEAEADLVYEMTDETRNALRGAGYADDEIKAMFNEDVKLILERIKSESGKRESAEIDFVIHGHTSPCHVNSYNHDDEIVLASCCIVTRTGPLEVAHATTRRRALKQAFDEFNPSAQPAFALGLECESVASPEPAWPICRKDVYGALLSRGYPDSSLRQLPADAFRILTELHDIDQVLKDRLVANVRDLAFIEKYSNNANCFNVCFVFDSGTQLLGFDIATYAFDASFSHEYSSKNYSDLVKFRDLFAKDFATFAMTKLIGGIEAAKSEALRNYQ